MNKVIEGLTSFYSYNLKVLLFPLSRFFTLILLQCLPNPYETQDANFLSLLYFNISGIDLIGKLDDLLSPEIKKKVIEFIYSLQVASLPIDLSYFFLSVR
jgi:hypothetical protein